MKFLGIKKTTWMFCLLLWSILFLSRCTRFEVSDARHWVWFVLGTGCLAFWDCERENP